MNLRTPPFTPPFSACEPYGPNGVRQMGGDHAGVHKDSLCVRACTSSDAHVVSWFVFRFLDLDMLLDVSFSAGASFFVNLKLCPFSVSHQLDPGRSPDTLRLCT